MIWYVKTADLITLHVYVQPGAKSTELSGLHDGLLKIRITASPTDGAANDALKKFIAQLFHVPNRQVKLVRGEKNRRKTLEIIGSLIDPEHLLLTLDKG